MGWSAEDQSSQPGSASETAARTTITGPHRRLVKGIARAAEKPAPVAVVRECATLDQGTDSGMSIPSGYLSEVLIIFSVPDGKPRRIRSKFFC